MAPAAGKQASIWALGGAIGPMVLMILSRRPIVDNSFLWHITAGHVQSSARRVLTADPFSFSRLGVPWRTQSWLIELGYAWADRMFGVAFGQFVAPIVGLLLFGVLMAIAQVKARAGLATALVLAGTVILLVPFLQPRPVIVSYLALAVLVLVVHQPKVHWTIPLIVWVWAASHGSFPLAFVLLATTWFSTRQASLVRAGLAAAVTLPLTAHGIGLVSVLSGFAQSGAALDKISEWQAPDLLELKFLPVTIAIPIVVRYLAREGVGLRNGLPVLAWFVFGLSAVRSVPLAWIVLFPLIVQSTDSLLGGRFTTSRLRTALVTWVGIVLIVFPLALPRGDALNETRFPLEAAELLMAERVFHDDITGGFLIYRHWPDRLVYVDDRAEVYGDELVRFAEVRNGSGDWQETFDEWDFEQALVRKADAISTVMTADPRWTLTFEDETFAIFSRSR